MTGHTTPALEAELLRGFIESYVRVEWGTDSIGRTLAWKTDASVELCVDAILAAGWRRAGEAEHEGLRGALMALTLCAEWLEAYAVEHVEKGSSEKARRNRDRAEMCRKVLAINAAAVGAERPWWSGVSPPAKDAEG